MRHVACTRHDIMAFHAQYYTYSYALEAITASFGRIYGMRHGMRRQGEFHHGWCPKTPFEMPGMTPRRGASSRPVEVDVRRLGGRELALTHGQKGAC